MRRDYWRTVRLLLDVAPAVFAGGRFAMKGGTALNLFVQDMPRMSVDIDVVFENEFAGMTTQPVSLHELQTTRAQLFANLPTAINARQRSFLMSMARADPDWALLPFAHASALPALRWKLLNLNKLKKNQTKFRHQHDELKARFAG